MQKDKILWWDDVWIMLSTELSFLGAPLIQINLIYVNEYEQSIGNDIFILLNQPSSQPWWTQLTVNEHVHLFQFTKKEFAPQKIFNPNPKVIFNQKPHSPTQKTLPYLKTNIMTIAWLHETILTKSDAISFVFQGSRLYKPKKKVLQRWVKNWNTKILLLLWLYLVKALSKGAAQWRNMYSCFTIWERNKKINQKLSVCISWWRFFEKSHSHSPEFIWF